MKGFTDIRRGDRVQIRVPAGIGRNGLEWKAKTGLVIMEGPAGWALDMGGRWGTPGVCTPSNFIKIVRSSIPD